MDEWGEGLTDRFMEAAFFSFPFFSFSSARLTNEPRIDECLKVHGKTAGADHIFRAAPGEIRFHFHRSRPFPSCLPTPFSFRVLSHCSRPPPKLISVFGFVRSKTAAINPSANDRTGFTAEGTTTVSSGKLLISRGCGGGWHFRFTRSSSPILFSFFDLCPWNSSAPARIRCKETLERYVSLRISIPGFL